MSLIQPFENKVLKTPLFWGFLGHLRPFLKPIFEASLVHDPVVAQRPTWAQNDHMGMLYRIINDTGTFFRMLGSIV